MLKYPSNHTKIKAQIIWPLITLNHQYTLAEICQGFHQNSFSNFQQTSFFANNHPRGTPE